MKKITLGVMGAGARGARAYVPYLLQHPHEGAVVAAAEPDAGRLAAIRTAHGIPTQNCFDHWQDLLAQPKLCDTLIISTLDDMHFEPTMKALELGYDILLEKPMSNISGQAEQIAARAEALGRRVLVCHVLRYTAFCRQLKACLDSGAIGDIVSVQHTENVGFFHQAHSFVRGNWNNSESSSPMILAKCCHDMDLLNWLIGKRCLRLSSFGSLSHFTAENAPPGSPEYCLDGCKHADSCPYYVMRYWENRSGHLGFAHMVCEPDAPTREGFIEKVRQGRYGRCVYKCQNNVVDHQVVNMEYEGGVTVAFTMCAFSDKIERTTKIMGTRGELRAHMEKNEIQIFDFLSGRETLIKTSAVESGHGGGDFGIMKDFLAYLRGEGVSGSITTAAASVPAHAMAFAAEQSRLERRVVEL